MISAIGRRAVLGGTVAALAVAGRAWAAQPSPWHGTDITGTLPYLYFTMTNAATGKTATEVDVRGKVVMLSFGYTSCPDICPLTLKRAAEVIHALGKPADDVRYLFVTIDPKRDTLPVLRDYVAAFGPNFVGLRSDDDETAALTNRYHAAFSVKPATATTPYTVTHTPAVYVFGRESNARLLESSLATPKPDIDGTKADLLRLLGDAPRPRGLLSMVMSSL